MAVNVYASAFVWKPEAEIECPTRAAVLRGQRIDPIWDLDLVPIARSPTSLIDRMSTKIGAAFILSSLTDKIPSLIFFLFTHVSQSQKGHCLLHVSVKPTVSSV